MLRGGLSGFCERRVAVRIAMFDIVQSLPMADDVDSR
jgi:hypothetical protein